MKKLKNEKTLNIFEDFVLTNDEMISVRGGDAGEPIVIPNLPPIRP